MTDQPLDKKSGCTMIPASLPVVVDDAITVVKTLGYRYLWVDRYCIEQENPENVEKQIAQMGQIYRDAEITIIAASDQGGLPGVSKFHRVEQTII